MTKQEKIWAKNVKQGWRFFQPNNARQSTPRTLREAEMLRHLTRSV
jgi:hypothetical protein